MNLFHWTAAHLDLLAGYCPPCPRLITPESVEQIIPGLDIWDHWPVLTETGELAQIACGLLVVALSAPRLSDPEARHAVARLRMLHLKAGEWRDLGDLLPSGLSSGSREWAGSAVLDASRRLTLYFTAAGRRGEESVSFDQRLYATSAMLEGNGLIPGAWAPPVELVRPDGDLYETVMTGDGAIGTIKAFRDPFFFRSAGEERDYLLFTGSRAGARSCWNGLVGLAGRDGDGWALMPPLVDATGLNNELERPHAIVHHGRTYLFWSTQAKVFAPGCHGPTGLYGLVADRLGGPWRPLNGHGLVLANPAEAPEQAYSWQVLPDLTVWSFANMIGPARAPTDIVTARAAFAGAPAPPLQLRIDDDRAEIVSETRA